MSVYYHKLKLPRLDILPLEIFVGSFDPIPIGNSEMPCCSGTHSRGYARGYARREQHKSAIYEREALELRRKALKRVR